MTIEAGGSADEAPVRFRRSRTVRLVLLEAALIVFGLLAALAVDQWRERRNQRERAAQAIASIREEIARNQEQVARSRDYHMHLMDTLRSFTQATGGKDVRPDMGTFSQGYFRPAVILTTAWNAATAADVVRHMPFQTVLQISDLYADQERYHQQTLDIGRSLFEMLFREGADGVVRNFRNLSTIHGSMVYRECQLLSRYALTRLELGADSASLGPAPGPFCERMLQPRR